MTLMPFLIIAPILLPLLTAALMLLLGEKRRPLKARINLVSTLLGLGIAVYLLYWVSLGAQGQIGVYLPGNWQAPFGIVLVIDRLAALMMVLTGIVGSCALLFATTRWHSAGASFHALFQVQMMGLYGAFLTGDLFNLFVFFEVLLAASYGLMLHGSGRARVSAGLHYITINLVASSLFLIGAALIYGVTGTLNLADMARKIPLVPASDLGLLHAGVAILATAFLAKAGMWPLNFWLVPAYSAASAPVAALFAIMTKVGVYTILRLWTLLFSSEAGASAHFGSEWLIYGGLLTIASAAISLIAAQRLERVAANSILVSAGVLLACIGFADARLTGAALFYLVSSTLAMCTLFLLAELIERSRSANEVAPDDDPDLLPRPLESLHLPLGSEPVDEPQPVGKPIPWTTAFLGLSFIACALLIIGMPPLTGFIAKLALISALFAGDGAGITTPGWWLTALLILSGLASLVTLARVGIQRFWTPRARPVSVLRLSEALPIVVMLGLCVGLTVGGQALLGATAATGLQLSNAQQYINAVMLAEPIPNAVDATAQVQP